MENIWRYFRGKRKRCKEPEVVRKIESFGKDSHFALHKQLHEKTPTSPAQNRMGDIHIYSIPRNIWRMETQTGLILITNSRIIYGYHLIEVTFSSAKVEAMSPNLLSNVETDLLRLLKGGSRALEVSHQNSQGNNLAEAHQAGIVT